ncbi:MAG: hypothetical protein RR619_11920, partial [Raoultibacter sp.]
MDGICATGDCGGVGAVWHSRGNSYGDPMRRIELPENQMALPGLGSDGEKLMGDARLWVARHYDEWRFFCAEAK